MKLPPFLHALRTINPIDDILYPALLDRFGHRVARRVCSAAMLLLGFTLIPLYIVIIFLYNTGMDLVYNAGGAWVAVIRDSVEGVIRGEIGGADQDDGE